MRDSSNFLKWQAFFMAGASLTTLLAPIVAGVDSINEI